MRDGRRLATYCLFVIARLRSVMFWITPNMRQGRPRLIPHHIALAMDDAHLAIRADPRYSKS
jgi:hypothetical protein